ncbi:helix-turn-helix domain-containing protein [Roseibium aggregatum]|uniref:AlbA family DNA-binding domain-containing protein n=1 Tax=Roseibium aggregatum TaxID=187304 RepID=UPI001E29EA53|nr:ATP-binding protein [Roseibium aggregatum]UES46808.1 hypothetical protein GFK90_25225 [Roseibium aggregatum]
MLGAICCSRPTDFLSGEIELLDRARQIAELGEEGIKSLLGQPESFQLEFKRKDDPTHPRLSDIDKRSISNEVSGFANAEGGLLIFGIGTGQEKKQDVAKDLKPIRQLRDFELEVKASISQHISPSVEGIELIAVPTKAYPEEGYLLIVVPASENGPHMSRAPKEHRYYRRSGEATSLMDDRLVRTMILAPREAKLGVRWRVTSEVSIGGNPRKYKNHLGLSLLNQTYRAATAPYVRLTSSPSLPFAGSNRDDLTFYRHEDSSVSVSGANTTVVHPLIPLPMMTVGLSFAVDAKDLEELIDGAEFASLLEPSRWLIGSRTALSDTPNDEFENGIELTLAYAAENASPTAQKTIMEKQHLVALFVETLSRRRATKAGNLQILRRALASVGAPITELLPVDTAFD